MSWNVEEAVAYYKTQGAPGDSSAVINLLREVQRENGGGIPQYLLGTLSEALGVKESLFLALIKRVPGLRLADTHCLELCAGPNCGKQAALADLAERLCGSQRRNVTLRYVPCMRLCGKGPNLRWDGKLYHRADEGLLRSLMENESGGN